MLNILINVKIHSLESLSNSGFRLNRISEGIIWIISLSQENYFFSKKLLSDSCLFLTLKKNPM